MSIVKITGKNFLTDDGWQMDEVHLHLSSTGPEDPHDTEVVVYRPGSPDEGQDTPNTWVNSWSTGEIEIDLYNEVFSNMWVQHVYGRSGDQVHEVSFEVTPPQQTATGPEIYLGYAAGLDRLQVDGSTPGMLNDPFYLVVSGEHPVGTGGWSNTIADYDWTDQQADYAYVDGYIGYAGVQGGARILSATAYSSDGNDTLIGTWSGEIIIPSDPPVVVTGYDVSPSEGEVQISIYGNNLNDNRFDRIKVDLLGGSGTVLYKTPRGVEYPNDPVTVSWTNTEIVFTYDPASTGFPERPIHLLTLRDGYQEFVIPVTVDPPEDQVPSGA